MGFSDILGSTFETFTSRFGRYALGMILFSCAMLAVGSLVTSSILGSSAVRQELQHFFGTSAVINQEGRIDIDIQDKAAMEQFFRKQFESAAGNTKKLSIPLSKELIYSLLPSVGTSILLAIIFYALALSYYFTVASFPEGTSLFAFALQKVIPLLAGYVLMGIISFLLAAIVAAVIALSAMFVGPLAIFVGIAGIVFLLIVSPRFILIPALIVKENKGPLLAVSASWERSRGNVFTIFFNLLIFNILMTIVFGVLSGGIKFLVPVSIPYAAYALSFVGLLLNQTKIALSSTFLVELLGYITPTSPLAPMKPPSGPPPPPQPATGSARQAGWPPKPVPPLSTSTPSSEAQSHL